jgi:ribonucleoside-diphosphate reductase alpha chain
MMYQRHWCEHKPSVTISVKEDEWMDVGAWVWRNFDEVSGVSFLPHDGGSYRQAPYEECSKEEYEKLLAKMPVTIDWDSLKEETDNVEGAQTLACVAGHCEI